MTVSNTTNVAQFPGTGVLAPFPIPFRFFKDTDLVVLKRSVSGISTPMILNIDYSVTGANKLTGGTVTPTSAALPGELITVARVLTVQQLTDLRNQGDYFAEIHEDVFDYLTMLIQQVGEGDGRALKHPRDSEHYQAEARRIVDLEDPVNAQDAVTLASLLTKLGALSTDGSGQFVLAALADASGTALGDALLGVRQPFPGSAPRTQHDKNTEFLSPEDFGAKGDGIADDTVALTAAFAAGPVMLGAKTYLVTGAINIVNKPLHIEGRSAARSKIKFVGVGGISVTNNDILIPLTLKNFALIADTPLAGTAIKGVWPTTASASNVTARIEGVEATGTVIGVNYWTRFIDLTEGWNAYICKNLSHGGGYATGSDYGIVLRGRSIDVICNENRLYSFGKAIAFLDLGEGLQLHSNVMIAVGYGIYSDHTSVTPGIYAIGNHISAYYGGIYAANTPQSFYIANLIYQITVSPALTAAYVGINVRTGSHISKICSNHVVFLAGVLVGGTGIVVSGSDGCSISDNTQQGGNTVAWAQTTASNYSISYNRANDTGVLVVLAEGTGENIIFGNKPVLSFTSLTSNSNSPNVRNSPTNVFQTTNTASTTINTFSSGTSGQEIEVLVNDNFTTIAHGVGILLKGAVSRAMTNGSIIRLRNYGNVWREVPQ